VHFCEGRDNEYIYTPQGADAKRENLLSGYNHHMNPSAIEQKIRAGFPLIRFMQVYMPLSLSHWLTRLGASRVRLPEDVTHEAVCADGVPCEWIIPRDSPKDRALLYLHGGGFVYGVSPNHLQMVAHLARKMGVRALMVDYRLAPKYPFPAPLDDCVTAYRWLLEQGISAQNSAVAGDSAGGNLTITTMMKLRDEGVPLPAAAACLSPVADLTGRDPLLKDLKDPLLPARAIERYNKSYLGHNDPRAPLISPVFGDWHGLPPLLIHAGGDEILRLDAQRVEELAKAAGVDVRLEVYARMWHVWQIYLSLPQAVASLDDIAGFLKSHLGHGT
jgi:monoterpene epsilon-lactone hydrolase